ncbi:hypothetical protein CRG98_037989 [Punica granatum]|uniref:Uncharacterized protein n=1 Tax=Punica granatum TaxID=22663 RepID=A0A2I0ICA7_PUNGR|nr:hypothetical protein CRG98_037989 [Punica granatum]
MQNCPGYEWSRLPRRMQMMLVASVLHDLRPRLCLVALALCASWRVRGVEVVGCSRKTVASMLSDSLDCLRLRLRRGYLIVGHLYRQSIRKGSETSSRGSVNLRIAFRLRPTFPVKDDKVDDVLGDCSVEYALMVTTDSGVGPFFCRRCDCASNPLAGGLGHALFVGAVAYDLLWREGCANTFMGKVDACSHDAEGRARLRQETCARSSDDVSNCTGNLSVIDPSVGEVDHGDCARREGDVLAESKYSRLNANYKVHRSRNRKDSNGTQGDSMDCLSKPGWRVAWRLSTMHGFSTIRTVPSRDGSSRLKGMNSWKSSGALWGPNR